MYSFNVHQKYNRSCSGLVSTALVIGILTFSSLLYAETNVTPFADLSSQIDKQGQTAMAKEMKQFQNHCHWKVTGESALAYQLGTSNLIATQIAHKDVLNPSN